MTTETLPTYPNLFELDEIKLTKIEESCRKVNHLALDEKLLDRISKDLLILQNANLTKEDIYIAHRNMNLKFNKTNKYMAFTSNCNGHDPHIGELLENLPKNFGNGWSLKGERTNEIELNGQHLRITCIVWNGVEVCPIEKSFTDKYFGYQRGDCDWFITNLNTGLKIWVPDLVPAQIGMFGFSHSPSLPYSMDLNKYIQIMGLDKLSEPIKFLTSHKEYFWGLPSGPSTLNYVKSESVNILDEVDNDTYHAFHCTRNGMEDNNEHLFIHFHDKDWITENKNLKIIVFGLEFYVANVFNYRDYLACIKSYCIVLDEDDQSEIIEKQINEQEPGCVVQ